MCGPGFATLPPDPDYCDGPLCVYCCSILEDDGSCAYCEPRCSLEDSPLVSSGFEIDGAGNVRSLAVTA